MKTSQNVPDGRFIVSSQPRSTRASLTRGPTPVGMILAVAGAALAALVSGCGGGAHGLSDGDNRVCNAATQKDALSVYANTAGISDTAIRNQASKIYFGSSDSGDADAMVQIVAVCRSKGFNPGL